MKSFWALLAVLRLALAALPPFDVNEDLFAFPHYEIVWQDNSPVSHEYAAEKLKLQKTRSSISPDASAQALSRHDGSVPSDSPAGGESAISSYETLVLADQRYLCSLPIIPPAEPSAPSNRTADEEANDLDLAVYRGQQLLKGMEGNCIYFISGWWSYSFCYNEGVRQFHPMASGRNVPVYPPVEDPSVEAYVLGRFHGQEANEEEDDDMSYDEELQSKKKAPKQKQMSKETGLAKLEVKGHKGSTRYLAQNLSGGSICDLTGEDRSIEVQFRCENIPTDRITVIKETSICQYRMVISTPRLCNDAAFRPPKGPKPHSIACSPVISSDSIQSYLDARQSANDDYEAELKASAMQGASQFFEQLKNVLGVDSVDANDETTMDEDGLPAGHIPGHIDHVMKQNLPRIGDITVGGHNLSPEGTVLRKGVVVGGVGNEKHIVTIARSDGYTATEKELSKYNIHGGKEFEKIKDKVRQKAEGAEWQIEIVENARGKKEIRGIIGDSKKEKSQKAKAAKKNKAKQEAEGHSDDYDDEYSAENDESAEGSEERYKEEL